VDGWRAHSYWEGGAVIRRRPGTGRYKVHFEDLMSSVCALPRFANLCRVASPERAMEAASE
jgi:hypothetical protein